MIVRAVLVAEDQKDSEHDARRVDVWVGHTLEDAAVVGRLTLPGDLAVGLVSLLNAQPGPFPGHRPWLADDEGGGFTDGPDVLEGLYARPWA